MRLRVLEDGRLIDRAGNADVFVTGQPGERRWSEELHVKYPKGSRAKSTEHHVRMRGGPWAGASVARNYKVWRGGKIAMRLPLELPDIWFSREFDGYYLLREGEYRWINPID